MHEHIELVASREGDSLKLLSPDVGLFTHALPSGQVLTAGSLAGVLIRLGRACELYVPDGVSGLIRNAPPERVLEPVGASSVLYELDDLTQIGEIEAPVNKSLNESEDSSQGLFFRAPQSGRFYHRPGPGEENFVSEGQVIASGDAIGLIEVMKTFNRVLYSGKGLPEQARVLRLCADDSSEVTEGQPLLEIEPA